ncbi:putative porin [Allomuricauda sp. d1]|uniref:putative porin n=1 Tax=Allomuricauda sp. d1 TaxID=3136725 RepID=UPI0031CEB606
MRLFLSLLAISFFQLTFAQKDSVAQKTESDTVLASVKSIDSVRLKKKRDSVKTLSIKDYKIISLSRDTTYFDTTQSIKKEYKFNFLREDDFELMPFANMGRPYNNLGRNFVSRDFFPNIGARARHFNYMEVYDIDYYHVPTPITDLMFKTTFEQGQMLDALLTFNTSEQLNLSVAYKGFRSLGKYRFEQVESGNFRTTFNYRTKNERYQAKGHITAQDLESEENGGIANREQFENGEDEFLDRSRIDVAYENANNRVLGKRYFLDHEFKLFSVKRDSLKKRATNLAIGHQFNYETRFYQFQQDDDNLAFGTQPFEEPIDDRARLKTMFNQLSAKFTNKTFGALTGNIALYDYDYFFNSILINEDGTTIQNSLEGNEITLGGDYSNQIGRLNLKGSFNYTLSGELSGNRFDASVNYLLNEDNVLFASIHSISRLPNFNFLLYQSDYRNFNWQNDYEKQNTQNLNVGFDSKAFGKLSVEYSIIDNYAYFGLDEGAVAAAEAALNEGETIDARLTSFVVPNQASESINYLKVKYEKEFKWRRWALNNTIMYQNVGQDAQILNVPELVTRNSLYYSKDVFKKAMFLQTGVTFKYFTSYNMDAYNPLLGEFYIQNREEFGGYPLLDFFINAKVRQTRIFLKAEHFNTIWSKEYNYYSAPNYPYRDFVIRFGLVWNFFS